MTFNVPRVCSFIIQPFCNGAVFIARPSALGAIMGFDGKPLGVEGLETVAFRMAETLWGRDSQGMA